MISGEETHLYNYSNSHYQIINKFSIHRQKGHKKGGQSSHRFMMIHDEQINQYVKHICELLNKHWYNGEDGRCMVKGIIIGGIGDIKSRIVKSEHVNHKLKDRILCEISISNFNIDDLVQKTNFIINKDKYDKERKILEDLLNMVTLDNATYIYGMDEIKLRLIRMEVKSLYVHTKVMDAISEILERGKDNGCEIIILGVEDETAQMFIEGYGGIIAKCWYSINTDN